MGLLPRLALAIVFLVAPLTIIGLAPIYARRQLERRYEKGPWTEATIDDVFLTGKGRSVSAHITFTNVVAGELRVCHAVAFMGSYLNPKRAGDKLRIAPEPGSCAEVATSYNCGVSLVLK